MAPWGQQSVLFSLLIAALLLSCSDSETARLRSAASNASPNPSASISPENIAFVEGASIEGLEVSLDKTKLKINPNAVSGRVKLKASITKIDDATHPAVELAGGAVVKIDVTNVETGSSIDADDINDSFVVRYDISERAGKRSDLIMLSPNGDREYIPAENLQGGSGLNLAMTNAETDQLIFKIPDMAEVGVIFWIADYRSLDVSFSEKDLSNISTQGTTTTGGSGAESSGSSSASASTSSSSGGDTGSTTSGADLTEPTVIQVTSSTANGAYKNGSSISIQVVFDEVVFVSGGIPTLRVETGTLDRDAVYASGSGTNTLSFNYTVMAGDSTSDLEVVSTSALSAVTATIKDEAGNNAVLNLPALGGGASLSGLKNIAVDTTSPPALTSFLCEQEASTSNIMCYLDWPASTIDYSNAKIRRISGATAPTNCTDSGTLLTTISSFATDPHQYTHSVGNGTYSYRACVFDAAGNSVSAVSENIIVNVNSSWKTPETFILSNTGVVKVAIGSSLSDSSIVVRVDDTGSGVDHNLYLREYNGTEWSSQSQVEPSSPQFLISSHAVFYDTEGVLRHAYDGATHCEPLKTADGFNMTKGNCLGLSGPSSKRVAYSNAAISGTPPDPSELALNSGGTWSSVPINPAENLARVIFQPDGALGAVFQNAGSHTYKRWNPSGSPTYNDWDLNIALPSSMSMHRVQIHSSVSGAMAASFSIANVPNSRSVQVKRRTTSGDWVATPDTLASNSASDTYDMVSAMDASGRIIVFYQSGIDDLNYKGFNGSSWGPETSLTTSDYEKMVACGNPDSDKMFFVWATFAQPQNEIKGVVITAGTVGSISTLYAPTNRVVEQLDIACNASGHAVIGFYQRNTSGLQKDYGTIIYGP